MGDARIPNRVDGNLLPLDQLVAALRACARGVYSTEAAIELLVRHDFWLRRPDFRKLIDVTPGFGDRSVTLASLDWEAAAATDFASSSSEEQILLACELAGVTTGRRLVGLLGGLDETNTTLVLRSLLHAARGASAGAVRVAPWTLAGEG